MLRLPPFRYHAPRTAAEAARMLRDLGPDAMVVAGGTDLYPNMKRRQFTPGVLLGLRGIEGGTGIHANGGLRLGALTTLTDIASDRGIGERWPVIARAAGLVASPLLRNAGTIGGNLCVDTRCNYYDQTEFWRASIGYCMKRDGDICLVAPGSSTGGPGDPPIHEPGSRETIFLSSGRVALVLEGERYELAEGDAVTFDADLPHHFENPGKEEAVLLAVVSAGLRRS